MLNEVNGSITAVVKTHNVLNVPFMARHGGT
jgi:hypothetical protein